MTMFNDPTPTDADRHPSRSVWRPIAVAVIGASALITTGVGVVATLTAAASNVTPQSVDSGTLALNLADNGDGFSQAISNLAPGDTVNRYVTLTNSGTLAGDVLDFTAVATGASTLIEDGTKPSTTKALRVSVDSCSKDWDPSTGKCSGDVTTLLEPIPLSAASTPRSLVPGSIAAGEVFELRVSITLPDQDETTVNGTPPVQSVQGAAVDIVYTFTESQRSTVTTDS